MKAQAKELAEAANLSNQQFNSAAKQLLEREKAGEIELPMTNRGTYRYVDFPKVFVIHSFFFRSLLQEDWDPLDYVERCPDYESPHGHGPSAKRRSRRK